MAVAAVAAANGVKLKAAEALGISRPALYRLLAKPAEAGTAAGHRHFTG
ncbi:helix-turn-helix domain-containing protein [Acinetobacter baumannii]|jgi:DNA-binding NtrC family response regulator